MLERLFDWAGGLIEIPAFGVLSLIEKTGSGVAAATRKEHRSWKNPFKLLLDFLWNVTTLAVAEVNQLVSPLWAAFDHDQPAGPVRYEDGMVWTSGGPAGSVIRSRREPRFRYFMPSQSLVMADQSQVACDCNPVNPGDPYDDNKANALHETILQERFPVGYVTGFAAPWAFSKSFRDREEDSSWNETLRRLTASPSR